MIGDKAMQTREKEYAASVPASLTEDTANGMTPANPDQPAKQENDLGLHIARQAFAIAWLLVPIGFYIQLELTHGDEFATSMVITFFLPATWCVGSWINLFVIRKTRRLESFGFLVLDFSLICVFSILAGFVFSAMYGTGIIPHLEDGYMGVVLWCIGLGGMIPAGIISFFVARPGEKTVAGTGKTSHPGFSGRDTAAKP